MINQSLGMPAKKNVIDLDFFRSNKPVQTISRPFAFYQVDDCGEKTPVDLTGQEFELVITFNECTQFTATTAAGTLVIGTGVDQNKVWLNVPILTVHKGVYQYALNLVSGESFARGNFVVKE